MAHKGGKGKGGNKLKRKRGKKFRFMDGEGDGTQVGKGKQTEGNPFEDHHSSKKANKDKLKRAQLINEFQTRGKNNVFIDKRIGVTSSKLSEEDKMRLRYMREQRDQLKLSKVSKKRAKYNLDDLNSEEEENDMFMGFTHGGRRLEEMDDFQDKIELSSDEEGGYEDRQDRDKRIGNLDEQMVMNMNFGGGAFSGDVRDKDQKKTRKEIFEEIIDKSKAYKMVRSEIKIATQDLSAKLDTEYFDLLPLLNLNKNKSAQRVIEDTKLDKSYEKLASMMVDQKRAQPIQVLMSDKEQAKQKKAKLQALAKQQNAGNDSDDSDNQQLRKRDSKMVDKREQAFKNMQKDTIEKYKNDIKASIVEDRVKEQIKKVQEKKGGKQVEIDSDLASEDDEEEYDEEEDNDDDNEEEDDDEEEEDDDDEDSS